MQLVQVCQTSGWRPWNRTIWEHRLFLQKASSLEKEQVKMVKALITW